MYQARLRKHSFIQPSPPVLKRSCLAVFPGGLCVPVLGAGLKPTLGISNGFTADAWSSAVKGFPPSFSFVCFVIALPPPRINNETEEQL